MYDFSFDFGGTYVDDIVDIHKYLMNKSNKVMFRLIKKVFIGLLSFSGSLASTANTSNVTACISLKNQ